MFDSDYHDFEQITEEVYKRWERNLRNLLLIKNKQIGVDASYYQKIMNSNRLTELQSFLDYYKKKIK
jgi:hypothetical protein